MSAVIRVRLRAGVKEELESAGIDISKESKRHLENLAWAIRSKKSLMETKEVIASKAKPSKRGFASSQIRKDRDRHS
jgi:hypothetical protein